jgi:hypothetical protein
MRQNSKYLWFLPLYFFLFFGSYTLLKFIIIFFFMGAYIPSFLFDFTIFYSFSGMDNTQLLFIALQVILINLFFHLSLSKRHLLYSFPLTIFLLGGIGLRVATSPFSLSYIFHYIVFSLLLLVLVIDHRIYLFLPSDFSVTATKSKMEIEKVPLPSFNPVHTRTQGSRPIVSSFSDVLNRSVTEAKHALRSRLGIGTPQSAASSQRIHQSMGTVESNIKRMETPAKEKYIHPIEKNADQIPTTKQLLQTIGTYPLDHLDSKINDTKYESTFSAESYFDGAPPKNRECFDHLPSDFSMILHDIVGTAAVISRGMIKAVNPTFSELLKRPMSDIIEHDFIQFIAPESLSDFKSHCVKRLSGESSQVFPIVLLNKKQERIYLQAQIKTVTINNQQVEVTIFTSQPA